MVHRIGQAAFKQPIHQMVGHAARDFIGGHAGLVNKAPAFKTMFNQTALLHLAQHGCHRGVGKISFLGQRPVNIGNRRFGTTPEHLHDLQLQITQAVCLWFCHVLNYYDHSNTTTVVVSSRGILNLF